MHPGASDEEDVQVRRASQGSRVKGGRRGVLWLSGVGASSFGFVGKCAEKTEKGWDASSSVGSIVWEFEKGHAARESSRGRWRVNSGAVDGYVVARERGTSERVTKEVFGERS